MFDKPIIIPLACDHGGYEMKEYIMEHLIEEGYQVKDYGTYSENSVDYPDFIHPLASAINDGEHLLGIIMCGSGNGAQMTANKYLKVRAALCWNEELTILARKHNDANILAMPGRFLDFEMAYRMVKLFLDTAFEGGRHTTRVNKICK